MKTKLIPIAAAISLVACGTAEEPQTEELAAAGPVAFVQMFEWDWNDIAVECETVLGPAGYTAVQVSPPNEHIQGPAWWTRYQPVSYKIESRNGTRAEFAEMVARCDAAGVGIYADAVINHMAGFPEGTGVAGSAFAEYDYPAVPYGVDDFHQCGRNDEDKVENYQDLEEVQTCQLGTLDDIDTGKPEVQARIAGYLNDLLSLGVAGFRIDAAKHMHHDDLHAILALVDGDPFLYQEVIDRGGEPISASDYLRDGHVTEFKYAALILDAFEKGNLDLLTGFWEQPGWLPGDQAVVFVDNHDIQRGHAFGDEVVNYKDGRNATNLPSRSCSPIRTAIRSSCRATHSRPTRTDRPMSSPLATGACDGALGLRAPARGIHAAHAQSSGAATAGTPNSANWAGCRRRRSCHFGRGEQRPRPASILMTRTGRASDVANETLPPARYDGFARRSAGGR